jgi:hypothetical protein
VSAFESYLRAVAGGEGYREEEHGDLFAAAWAELEAAYLERLRVAIKPWSGWQERFRAGAHETAALVETCRAEARFMVIEAISVGEPGRRRQKALGKRIAAFLDLAREELEEPEAIPPATAQWIASIFFDRIYRRCASESGDDLRLQLPELQFLGIAAFFGTQAGLSEFLAED